MKRIPAMTVMLVPAVFAFAGGSSDSRSFSESAKPAPLVLRVATGITEVHPTYKGCEEFGKLLNQKIPGRFTVQMYGGSQLGDDVRVTEQVQMGVLEMATTSSSPIVGLVPKFQALDLPFLFSSEKAADAVLDGPIGKELADALAVQNIKLVAYFDGGFRQLTNSRKEVRSPADLKGLKIRTMENQIHLAAWKALGASPTPMPFSEVFSAMQQKTIDGQENPVAIVVSQKFYEVQKYVTITSHVWQPHLLIMSMKLFKSLTPAERKAVEESGTEAAVFQRALTRSMTATYVKQLKDAGLTVSELTPAESKAFQDGVQPVYDQYSDKIGKDFLKRIKTAADSAK